MRVAIDTNGLFTNQAGIARQIRGLLRGLKAIGPAGVEIHELAWEVENFSYAQPGRAFKTAYRELIWAPFVAPGKLRRGRFGLLHSAGGHMVEPPRGVRHLFTFHDVAVLRHPERYRPWQRWRAQRLLQNNVNADRIICISQFTADEIIKLLGIAPSRIDVVYNGCDFHPEEPQPAESRPEREVPDDYFLFVGSLEPGKNLGLLREMYELAETRGIALPPLMIVGARWQGVPGEGPPPANWHYLGYQPDEVLVYLYRRARALLFPSKYEGFGLPVVEAMALGCPVICSPVASLTEIGGDAVLFAEMSAAAYLNVVQRLLKESELRGELITKGNEHVKKFSWRRCGQETLAVYQKVLGC